MPTGDDESGFDCGCTARIAAALGVVPPGRYLLAASGGADSTALAHLAAADGRLAVTLVHLDHRLRGGESDDDAAFVRRLAGRLRLPAVVASIEQFPPPAAVTNPSARYRAARLALYRAAAESHRADGVLLAHHADDQAEGVLLRVLRGTGLAGLGGMAARARVGGLELHRPLLGVRREALRDYLRRTGRPWREDSSNASPRYRRNVVRRLLTDRPELVPPLLDLAAAARRWAAALDDAGPQPDLHRKISVETFRSPAPVADRLAGRWLVAQDAPADAVSPDVRRRLVMQAIDARTAARQNYPGGLLVRRFQNFLQTVPAPPIRGRSLQLPRTPTTAPPTTNHGQSEATDAGEF